MAHLSRRHFVQALGIGTTGLLAACAPAAPAAPTAAPAATPTAAPKPAAPAATAPAAASPAVTQPAASPVGAASPGASPVAKPAASPAASPAAKPAGSPVAVSKPVAPLPSRARVRVALGAQISNLPIHFAADSGAFERAGLDLEITSVRGTTQDLMPSMARGEIDIMNLTPAPSLYNQLNEGFDIKIPFSLALDRQGRITSVWLGVLKEKENEIKTVADLRGKTVEAVAVGSPPDVLVHLALREARIDPKDVNLTYRVRQGPPDLLALAQNKAADVIGMLEPIGTQLVQQGLISRWISGADVIPWYQPYLGIASSRMYGDNRAALVKFLEVYLSSVRQINATNGTWTPELTATAAKWTQVPPAVVTAQGGVPYFDPNGAVSTESFERTQQFWVERAQVTRPVQISRLVDTTPLDEALAGVGRA